ncbi:MAG: hypothetical protein IJV00_02505 [Clostridia bacterium]|nr:hypothetical protein [Clostridia bacterium]
MKKLFSIILVFLIAAALFSCENAQKKTAAKTKESVQKSGAESASVSTDELIKTETKDPSELSGYESYTVISPGETDSFAGKLPYEKISFYTEPFIDKDAAYSFTYTLPDGTELEGYYRDSAAVRQSAYSQIDRYDVNSENAVGLLSVDHESGKLVSFFYSDKEKLKNHALDPETSRLNAEECVRLAWESFETFVGDASLYTIDQVGSPIQMTDQDKDGYVINSYKVEITKYVGEIPTFDKAFFTVADTGDLISWDIEYIGSVDSGALPGIDVEKIDAIADDVNAAALEYYGENCENAETYVEEMTYLFLDGSRPALQLAIKSAVSLYDDPNAPFYGGVILYVLL